MTTIGTSWLSIRIAVVGLLLSAFGDEIATIALALKLSGAHESMASVAVLMAAGMVPGVILPPYTARLITRFPPPVILEAAVVSQGIVVACAATSRTLAPVLICVVILGGLGSVGLSSMLSMLPVIVPPNSLFTVNKWIEIGQNIGYVGGPGIAAALVTLGGTRLALLADSASFLVEATAILPMSLGVLRGQGRTAGESTGTLPQKKSGGHWANVRELISDENRRAVLQPVLVSIASSSMLNVALVFYVRSHVHGGSAAYGPVVSALSCGLILGPLVFAKVLKNIDVGYLALGSAIVIGIMMSCVALTLFPDLIAAFLLLLGCANGLQNVSLTTFIMRTIGDDRRTTLTATYVGCLQTMVVIGFAAAGSFQSRWSEQVLLLGGLISAVSCLTGMLRYTPHIPQSTQRREGDTSNDGNEPVRA